MNDILIVSAFSMAIGFLLGMAVGMARPTILDVPDADRPLRDPKTGRYMKRGDK